jgi:predicted nucleotidyltransferase component of viral defense system
LIPRLNIIAWSAQAPWAEMRQVEQDLIISRALVELFDDPLLRAELRFRGGTALNKLLFPKPIRYSEDIDLVRTTAGPVGPILDRVRAVLEPWLGEAAFAQSQLAPKLRFRAEPEDGGSDLRLKVELNTHDVRAYDPTQTIPLVIENPWFSGIAEIATFSREELLATKLRALLQRDKGRDLLDLAHALIVFPDLDTVRIVECLRLHLEAANTPICRAEAEQRMFRKLAVPRFLADIRPLLPPDEATRRTDGAIRRAFAEVFERVIVLLPGAPWTKTPEMAKRFALELRNVAQSGTEA